MIRKGKYKKKINNMYAKKYKCKNLKKIIYYIICKI